MKPATELATYPGNDRGKALEALDILGKVGTLVLGAVLAFLGQTFLARQKRNETAETKIAELETLVAVLTNRVSAVEVQHSALSCTMRRVEETLARLDKKLAVMTGAVED